jgi:hypothetical protein
VRVSIQGWGVTCGLWFEAALACDSPGWGA